MIRAGRGPEGITGRVIDREARKVTGHPLRLKEGLIRSALRPEACVERRGLPGGTAPAEVIRVVEKAAKDLLKEERHLEKRREKRRRAEALLLKTARALAGKG